MQLQVYMRPWLPEEQYRNIFTFGVYNTQRQLERSSFLSEVEQDVTNLTCSETPSLAANLLSSSRYSTFSLRRLSYPP
ncbi:Os04g0589650 [Oryza sativa Japonica Group]|uniref:Os04g0589650 protein n=1 Tax=Oryza sativa subsp. japonica TaxID=39947 RepID=A0A0P0WE52_ORYSJ|nr:hypothetical protein EE612_025253 [Oryza sativa]BAS90735.1 Os04g0589650 [Oryza sativa Japonica Group]